MLEKLHHLPSNITIAEIEKKIRRCQNLDESRADIENFRAYFGLVPMSIS
jgi:hypothetical protein